MPVMKTAEAITCCDVITKDFLVSEGGRELPTQRNKQAKYSCK